MQECEGPQCLLLRATRTRVARCCTRLPDAYERSYGEQFPFRRRPRRRPSQYPRTHESVAQAVSDLTRPLGASRTEVFPCIAFMTPVTNLYRDLLHRDRRPLVSSSHRMARRVPLESGARSRNRYQRPLPKEQRSGLR